VEALMSDFNSHAVFWYGFENHRKDISCLKVVAPGNFAGKIEAFNENFRPKNFHYFCRILSQYNV
jgi:hypothetical protein